MNRFERLNSSSSKAIAVLADSLGDEYEERIVAGAVAGAREAGSSLLCVTGGSIDDPSPERAAGNFVFDLIGPGNTEGIVAISSSLCHAIGPSRLEAWAARFAGMPLCSIGVPLSGRPCIQVDNESGARASIAHLIQQHGLRRIAYIRGPRASAEADFREGAYRAALEAGGIEVDPRWIVEGNFTRASGEGAIAVLFDERRLKPDSLEAIAAANDYMALGALEELGKRGIRVPEQLALVGFDDVESARFARPALTTVRQPTEMLGRRAALALAELIRGKPSRASEMLPTELVIRTSCRCRSALDGGISLRVNLVAGRSLQASFVHRRQIIVAELARAARGHLGAAGSGWESRLIDALLNELRGLRTSFTSEVAKTLQKLERTRVDGDLIQEVLSGLRLQSLPCVAEDPVARDRLEEALHEARVFAASFATEAAASRNRRERDRRALFHRALRSAMFASANDVSRVCAAALPRFGVEACVVAALTKPGDVGGEARVAFGFGPGGKLAVSEPIRLAALPSHELLERSGRTAVLFPIVLQAQPLGAALVSVGHLDGHLIEDLADAFAAVLMVRTLTRAQQGG